MLKTPILYLIYNRPEITMVSFEILRRVKPTHLYIAADGPSPSKKGDRRQCLLARSVCDAIDWPCEVKTLYRSKNLGCRKAVSSGIDWFFDHVDEGIILEDDCVPELSFFPYCELLLKKYRNNKMIMHIGGNNYQKQSPYGNASYYFSRLNHIWGWATWKRAWLDYDVDAIDFPEFVKAKKIRSLFSHLDERHFWLQVFRHGYEKTVDTWDFQWTFTVMKNGGLSILPNVNLVKNIGFSPTSTHTNVVNSLALIETSPMHFPLKHPAKMIVDTKADRYTYTNILRKPASLKQRLLHTLELFYENFKSINT